MASPPPRLQVSETSPAKNDPDEDYFLRVVENDSETPVVNAKVRLELSDSAKTIKQGNTDGAGFFSFKWQRTSQPVRVHITVQAPGFVALDEYGPLKPDWLVQLDRPAVITTNSR